MYKKTKVEEIKIELDSLEIGKSIDKQALIKKHWGNYISSEFNDFFMTRSFDVAFHNAKKLLPGKKFKTKSGMIERVQFQDASELMTAESVVLVNGTVI